MVIEPIGSERPGALERFIESDLDELPFFRIDLGAGGNGKKTSERNYPNEQRPIFSVTPLSAEIPSSHLIFRPAHEYVVTASQAIILAGMNGVKKLLHTRYRVNDLEKTVRFYVEVLGLQETRRHKSPRGSELVFLKAPGSEELIEVCYFPSSGPVQVQPDLTHLAFQVDNLEEFGKHLAAHGIKYSDGPHIKENGSGFAFIDAPEGYEIELMQLAGSGY